MEAARERKAKQKATNYIDAPQVDRPHWQSRQQEERPPPPSGRQNADVGNHPKFNDFERLTGKSEANLMTAAGEILEKYNQAKTDMEKRMLMAKYILLFVSGMRLLTKNWTSLYRKASRE